VALQDAGGPVFPHIEKKGDLVRLDPLLVGDD
jgi:hypothetical protein